MNPLDTHTRRTAEALLAEAAKLREQYAGQPEKHPCGLTVGDTFEYPAFKGTGEPGDLDDPAHIVTVLRGPEARPDALGRLFPSFWCREAGSEREGWMSFGLGARARFRIVTERGAETAKQGTALRFEGER